MATTRRVIKDNAFVRARLENSPTLELIPAYNRFSPYKNPPKQCLAMSETFKEYLTYFSSISSVIAPYVDLLFQLPLFTGDPLVPTDEGINGLVQDYLDMHPIASADTPAPHVTFSGTVDGSGFKIGDSVVVLMWKYLGTGVPSGEPGWATLYSYFVALEDYALTDGTSIVFSTKVPANEDVYFAAVSVPAWSGCLLDMTMISSMGKGTWEDTSLAQTGYTIDIAPPGIAP